MAITIIRHKVKDYIAWRKVFDEYETMRKAGGEQGATVVQVVGDPNDVIVINTWRSMDAAETFLANSELKIAMEKAGVEGKPEFIYGNNSY